MYCSGARSVERLNISLRPYAPVQVGELLADGVEAMLRALVGDDEVRRGNDAGRIVRQVVEEAVCDIVDRGGSVKLEGGRAFVHSRLGGAERDQVRKRDDLVRITVEVCGAVRQHEADRRKRKTES